MCLIYQYEELKTMENYFEILQYLYFQKELIKGKIIFF